MKIVYFTHSLASCWNHGNAHFLRGLLQALQALQHTVVACEPAHGWSRSNLVADHGEEALRGFSERFPSLSPTLYGERPDVEALLDGADVVMVHEWTEPALVAAIGSVRKHGGRFTLLFHDTHHRTVSDPEAMRAFDLSGYDGVLAFGRSLAERYRQWGWGDRVFVLHEAADIRLFSPPEAPVDREGLVWIGNWGDGERSYEIEHFVLRPSSELGLPLDIFGVRYSTDARAALTRHGARYCGWLPNAEAPRTFARYMATVHVPRRFYAEQLAGVPTIRMFEALACGIPLVSAPWQDSEDLFRDGRDYLQARSPGEMRNHLRALAADPDLRQSVALSGLERIRERHTCDHRAEELLGIIAGLRQGELKGAA